MKVVTDSNELAALCARLAACEFVAVDTEFMRETTFWPRLCLIQMAGGSDEALVDAQAPGLDLAPFFSLMTNERVLKVFHAARQDVEIVHHMANVIPHPLFDTQIAAMVCGFGESVSYGMLVKKLLRHDLDKTSRFTDWSRRPLSDKQLHYALGDVTHLRDLFPQLQHQLEQSGRARWLDEEMAVLTDPATYQQHPELAWQRLKQRGKSRKAFAIMMELAEWREREAQEQDVPRRRVLKDEAIQDIAQQAPETESELDSLRSLHRGFARSARGRAVLEAVARGRRRDMSSVPRIERNEPLDSGEAAILDLLRVLLKSAAARHGVAPKLIANGEDLERIVREDEADVPGLKGWRRKLFGDDALKLKRGELALAIRDGQVTTVPDHKRAGGAASVREDAVPAYQAVARSRPEDA
ncbi:MAG: ribonuclease D [Pseudomonadota bacterium]|nr:ribonuclease D [Pseudomonadota bacterium]